MYHDENHLQSTSSILLWKIGEVVGDLEFLFGSGRLVSSLGDELDSKGTERSIGDHKRC